MAVTSFGKKVACDMAVTNPAHRWSGGGASLHGGRSRQKAIPPGAWSRRQLKWFAPGPMPTQNIADHPAQASSPTSKTFAGGEPDANARTQRFTTAQPSVAANPEKARRDRL
jgi:hypothetical protein